MAEETLARALADCLEGLRESAAEMEQRLARYPALRPELDELLRVVELIPSLPPVLAPDPAFVERTRRRLVVQSDEPRAPGAPGAPGWDPTLA